MSFSTMNSRQHHTLTVEERGDYGRKEALRDTLLQVQCLQALGKDVPLALIIELQTLYSQVFENA